MPRNGQLYERSTSEHRTGDREYSFSPQRIPPTPHLPTPTATDYKRDNYPSVNKRKSPAITACDYHFPDRTSGNYASAIRSWGLATRTAPQPTVETRTGTKTSARFIEWMMGYSEGWVDGISRSQQIKALGNAVCPQQAEYALSELRRRLTPCAQ